VAGEEQELMLPWWRGFKGTIKKTGEHKYDVTGIARKISDTSIEIIHSSGTSYCTRR
jgi:DNA topoisomerase-2